MNPGSCCVMLMAESRFGIGTMSPWPQPAWCQRLLCNGVGMFSWHTLGPLILIEQCLNATAYLNIVADQVHLFMATGSSDPVLDGYT
jgi:hypothetical protein